MVITNSLFFGVYKKIMKTFVKIDLSPSLSLSLYSNTNRFS